MRAATKALPQDAYIADAAPVKLGGLVALAAVVFELAPGDVPAGGAGGGGATEVVVGVDGTGVAVSISLAVSVSLSLSLSLAGGGGGRTCVVPL